MYEIVINFLLFVAAKILLFYCCFYAGLIGFFAAMMAIFYTTLDMAVPKWQLDRSLIGNNPGKFLKKNIIFLQLNIVETLF